MISTLLVLSMGLAAQESIVPTPDDGPAAPEPLRIRSVALFKNGLAWVRSSAALPPSGTGLFSGAPEAVHGTLWVGADAPVQVRATEVIAEVAFDGRWEHDPQGALAGARVSIVLDALEVPLTGRVAPAPTADERGWNRDFSGGSRRWGPAVVPGTRGAPRFLAVEEGGLSYVPIEDIRLLRVLESPPPRLERRPGLELTGAAGAAQVDVSYLTKGLSWAPSYRVALLEGGRLGLVQAAVLRNELADLNDVEVQLVTGYPNMPLSHVLSPLAPGQDWASFFEALGTRMNGPRESMSMMMQNRAAPTPSSASAPGDADEGVDLEYRSIGRHTLAEGDAVQVETARGEASYERVVQWTLPDGRDAWGRVQRGSDDEEPWDALRFDNPLGVPMTTAPATVTDGGRFLGSRVVEWTAPGARVTLPVTKALAIRTATTEYEEEASREAIVRWGDRYRSSTVRGEIRLGNQRGEAVTMVVTKTLSGELMEADREPESRLTARGAWAVNPRRELVWTVDLAPGEEVTLAYRYRVLVRS